MNNTNLIDTEWTPKRQRTRKTQVVCHLCPKDAWTGAAYHQTDAGPGIEDKPQLEMWGM